MKNPHAQCIARALVEMSRVLQPEEYAAACDAALQLAERSGCSDLRSFPDHVLHALEQHQNILFVSISTPSGSLGSQRDSLMKTLRAQSGKSIHLKEITSPSLLGGAVLQIGDELYDASIQGQMTHIVDSFLKPLAQSLSAV